MRLTAKEVEKFELLKVWIVKKLAERVTLSQVTLENAKILNLKKSKRRNKHFYKMWTSH